MVHIVWLNYVSVVRSLLRQQQRALFSRSRLWDRQVDIARTGAGRLVEHVNRQGPWFAPGQRPLAGSGVRDFLIRYFVNYDSTSDVERRWSASCVMRGTGSERIHTTKFVFLHEFRCYSFVSD